MICVFCKSSDHRSIINLGHQPLSCKFPKKKSEKIPNFSLNLVKCNKCELYQLKNLVNPSLMYGEDYGYYSSISPLMKNHLRKKFIENKKFLKSNSNILDIGSNDGTLLNYFSKIRYQCYGIDPNINLFSHNYHSKIMKFPNLFSEKIIKNQNFKNKYFDLIFSIAMFYDISEPKKFTDTIYKLLSPRGIWVLELSYLKLLSENMTFDQICHEHVTYYSISTLKMILDSSNLKIIDISFNEINGGSVELKISKKTAKFSSYKHLDKILKNESDYFSNNLKDFVNRVKNSKVSLLSLLKIISKNNKIYGYGASTKGNIIINYLGLSQKYINKICDANKFKYNHYTPGSKIKIISKNQMRKEKPDYLFVFIWSFRNEVIKQELDYIKNGGTLIIPFPTIHFVNKDNYKRYLKSDLSEFAFKY